MKMFNITVGIPAYNEEQNIKKLILSILDQRTVSIELKEIIIVNDVSTDRTISEIQSVSDPRIRLIEMQTRSGLAAGQNRIAREATGDILVLMDADVLPFNRDFLEEICRPLRADASLGLVGADVVPLPGKNFIEKVLITSHEIKTDIYRKIRGGDTIYLCHGRARAFSRALYTAIQWPDKFAEDQYSYLFARAKHFGFAYARNAVVLFRSPSSILDHFRQSLRFINGHKTIIKEFDSRAAAEEYRVPVVYIIASTVSYLLKKPVYTVSYVIILSMARILSYFIKLKNQSSYEPSISSKKL